jgi:hypothetical protein
MNLFSTLLVFLLLCSGTLFSQDRNCATMEVLESQIKENPQLLQNMEKIERMTEDFIRKNPNGSGVRNIITIPVVVHVLYRTAEENISDAQIQSQIDVLNQDFSALNTELNPPDGPNTPLGIFLGLQADVQVQFCLAQRDPSGNATTGITRRVTTNTSWGTGTAVKTTSQGGTSPWNTSQYLNIWVCNIGGGILGYAQFPGGSAATDGVVIDYRYTGNIGTATAPYGKGRTCTHEVGHWLNLRHIWGDATCGSDLVSDTPVHNTSNGGCPVYPHLSTCSGNPVEMTMNYMDYTFDACMYMFSNGQKARMRAVLESGGARASLATSPGCMPVDPNACNAPISLNIGSITNNSATADWSAVANATEYTFEYKLSTSSTWTTQNVNFTFTTLSGLNSSSTYNARVKASCSSGASPYSAIVNFTTAAPLPCTAPTGLAVSGVSSTGANANWNAVAGASSYDFEYKLNSSSTWTVLNVSSPPVSLTGLTASSAYNMRVKTICSSNSSSYSAIVNFTTTSPPGSCNDTYESNNTQSAAKSIAVNTNINAKIGTSTDVDWFSFKNTKNAKNIRVTLSNLPANYNVRLYKGNTLVGSSSNTGTTDEVIIFNTTTKETTYRVEIFGVSGAFNNSLCYQLRAEISGTPYRVFTPEDETQTFIATDEILVYPNPSSDFVTIAIPFENQVSLGDLSIFDMTGKMVSTQKIQINKDINKFSYDVSPLNEGIYLVHYKNENQVYTQKMMVTKN